jgi:hypothetical protein
LGIVFEAAVVLHEGGEHFFSGVADGWVAEVVGEGDGFCEVGVEAECGGDGAGDGGDLHGVGEAGAEVVTGAVEEDLGFGFEPTEGAGVDDAGAVALEVGAPRVREFRVGAADGLTAELGPWGETGEFF